MAATTQLEEAKQELVDEFEQSVRAKQRDAHRLEKAALKLHEPLADAEVEYETVDRRGRPRTEIVKIKSAIDEFTAKIASTSLEIESLWAT